MKRQYKEAFPKRHALFTVVHAVNLEQVLRNIRISYECGADGSFLINHATTPTELWHFYRAARLALPRFWLGINVLGEDPIAVLQSIPDDGSIWVDSAGVSDVEVSEAARRFRRLRSNLRWEGLYFGGIAFKGQAPVAQPARAARLAMRYVDVITTSGVGTGIPPSVEKVANMRTAVAGHPIAIASGMTPENVRDYLPYADCFLVSTGISDERDRNNLSPERIREFVHALRHLRVVK